MDCARRAHVAERRGEAAPRLRRRRSPAPYFLVDAMQWVVDRDVQSLVVDLPSLDRADDGGELAAHRTYWGLPRGSVDATQARRGRALVTELAYVPETASDGLYLLDLQVPAWVADAAPSRPVCSGSPSSTRPRRSRAVRLDREHAQVLDAADPLTAWRDRFVLPQRSGRGARPRVSLRSFARRAAACSLRTTSRKSCATGARSASKVTFTAGIRGCATTSGWPSRWPDSSAPGRRSRGDELADGQPAPAARELLPAGRARTALLIEQHAFPSDRYALESAGAVPRARSGAGPASSSRRATARLACAPRTSIETLERDGVAYRDVLLPGVQYLTGQATRHRGDHAGGAARPDAGRLGPGALDRQRPARSCTTGTPTSRSGAITST